MSLRYVGANLSNTEPVPAGPYANGAAPGMWNLQTQMQSRKAGIWPLTTGGTAPTSATYSSAGAYAWLCPAGVTSVSVVSVGGGGAANIQSGSPASTWYGGGGGGLGWKNNISVTPGTAYAVYVGAGGSDQSSYSGFDSYFINSSTVKGGGGSISGRGTGGTYTGDGGGNGGSAYSASSSSGNFYAPGGGGAGGYLGPGGNGGYSNGPTSPALVGVVYQTFDNSAGSASSFLRLTPVTYTSAWDNIRLSMMSSVVMSNGNIFVAWITSSNSFNVQFAIYDTSGNVVVAATTIESNPGSSSAQTGVKVCLTRGGNVAVVWDRYGSALGNVGNCYYAVYNTSGTVVKSAAVANTGSQYYIQNFAIRTTLQSSTGFVLVAMAYQTSPATYIYVISYSDTGTQLSIVTAINADSSNSYNNRVLDVAQMTGNLVGIIFSQNNTATWRTYISATNLSASGSGTFDAAGFTINSAQAIGMSNGNIMYAYLSSSSIRYRIYDSSNNSVGSVGSVTVTPPVASSQYNVYSRLSAVRLSNNNILFTYAVNDSLSSLKAVIVDNTPSTVLSETTIASTYNAVNLGVCTLPSGGFVPFYTFLGGGGMGGLARYNGTGDPGGNVGGDGIGATSLTGGGAGSPGSVNGGGGGYYNWNSSSYNSGQTGYVRILYGSSKSFPYNAA